MFPTPCFRSFQYLLVYLGNACICAHDYILVDHTCTNKPIAFTLDYTSTATIIYASLLVRHFFAIGEFLKL